MTDEEDIPSCRFCLNSKETPRNILLSPCECKGSIRYVHVACLNRWRHMDPNKNAVQCLLCLTDYNLPYESDLENLPSEKTWSVLALRYPIFLYGIIHYIWIFHQHYRIEKRTLVYEYSSPVSLLIPYQFIFQSTYFILFVREWKVKHKKKYFSLWVSPTGVLLISLHVLSLFYFLQENYLMTLPLLMVFTLYYRYHKLILLNINNGIN